MPKGLDLVFKRERVCGNMFLETKNLLILFFF